MLGSKAREAQGSPGLVGLPVGARPWEALSDRQRRTKRRIAAGSREVDDAMDRILGVAPGGVRTWMERKAGLKFVEFGDRLRRSMATILGRVRVWAGAMQGGEEFKREAASVQEEALRLDFGGHPRGRKLPAGVFPATEATRLP